MMCPWICPPPLVLSHGTFLRGLSGLCHSCADHSSLLSVVGPSQLHFCGLHVSRPISLREIPRSGLGVGVPSYLGKLMLQGGAPHLPSRGLGQRSVACRNAWGLQCRDCRCCPKPPRVCFHFLLVYQRGGHWSLTVTSLLCDDGAESM